MPAYAGQDLDGLIRLPHHDEGFISNRYREVVARVRNLTLMTQSQPLAVEESF